MAVQTNANKINKSQSMGKFFKQVKAELKKVIWPSRNDLVSFTTVVLATCAIATVGVWIADTVFGRALQMFIK
jgi:preprotein translocase subunit SecE